MIAFLLSAMLLPGSAAFAAFSDPTTLTIQDERHNAPDKYPVEKLRSRYENVEIETRTPWSKAGQVATFRGPRIRDVLREHGLDIGESVQFIAYDNFTSEITLEEIVTYNPIFAIDRACLDSDRASGRCTPEQDFTPLSPEEQGPIFLVWPYKDLPTAYVPARNSIWVWFVVAVRQPL
jgi:hypothetical protein